MTTNPVDILLKKGGGAAQLAKDLGVTRQAIYHWRGQGYVPTGRLVEIEKRYGIPRKLLANPTLRPVLGDSEASDLI